MSRRFYGLVCFCMLFSIILLGVMPALAKEGNSPNRLVSSRNPNQDEACPSASGVEFIDYAGRDESLKVLKNRALSISGRVYLPPNYGASVSPILFFLHGNSTDQNMHTSHLGYTYLACPLASAGFIVVSISADEINALTPNYGVTPVPMPTDDPGGYLVRGRLVLRHLELWSHWNAGSPDPDNIVLPLLPAQPSMAGQVDLQQVGLMGHSRGGEGVRAAYNYLNEKLKNVAADSLYTWPLPSLPTIRAIFEIAPADYLSSSTNNYAPLNADGVVWNLLLGMCDGDTELAGLKPFDRMLYNAVESPAFPKQKSAFIIWGANHNNFNTQWSPEGIGKCAGEGNGVLNGTTRDLIPVDDQRSLALQTMSAFFTGNVGTTPNVGANKIFNPLTSISGLLPNMPRIQRVFTLSPDKSTTSLIEKFGTTNLAAKSLNNVSFSAVQMLSEFNGGIAYDPIQFAGRIEWPDISTGTPSFQSNWFAKGYGFFVEPGFQTLDLRLARKPSDKNPTGPTNFSLCLVLDNDQCSQPVTLSSEDFELVGPAGIQSAPGLQPVLQTLRIPLSHFCDVDSTSRVRGLRLNFDETSSGAIYVADIGFSKELGPDVTVQPRTCLTSPANGSYNQTSRTLSWDAVPEAASYDVAVWRMDNHTPDGPIATVSGTQFSLANINPGLESGVQYLWKVTARAHDGRFTESGVRSFTFSPFPSDIISVWTNPEEISPEKNLPGLFDGLTYPNYAIRDFNIGEAVSILMEFANPTTLTGFNAGFGGDANRFDAYSVSVQAADTIESITSANPQQNILTNAPAPGKAIDINLQFGAPRTAKFFKVIVKRNDGDRRVHIYEMRPLLNSASGGSISGKVLANGSPVNTALVQVCADQNTCAITATNTLGQYAAFNLSAGNYIVTAFPPAGSNLSKTSSTPLTLAAEQSITAPDLILGASSAPPPGTTITSRSTGANGIPIVYWNDTLTLNTQGCPGGSAAYNIRQNGVSVRNDVMTETAPPGTYTAQIAALYPLHGDAQVEITIACPPDGTTETTLFDIYIDPSGWVHNVDGTPISGATVTLYRSSLSSGPFQMVANGSAVMSPLNRQNPDLTDGAGHFGWDVIAGYYKVRAEKTGCLSASDATQSYAESAVLTIPPAVFDLDLRLDCPATPTPTATVTVTETVTLTMTPTPTGTASSTLTMTPKATLTATVKPTLTKTRTSTWTATPTPTVTNTGYPATLTGLKTLLQDLKQQNKLDNQFYKPANILVALAEELLQHKRQQAAVIALQVFVEFTEQQSRISHQKHITSAAAQQLIDLTEAVIRTLR